MRPTILQLENLSIGYVNQRPRKVVHSGINLSLKKGELTCLLGTNGAGKSTLLKTLSGFQMGIEGKVFLEGDEIHFISKKKLARKLSVVLTDSIAAGNLTVYEVVSFGRYVYSDFFGRLRAKDDEMIRYALECVGISHFAQRNIIELSDGERQKVMIAKAIAQETPLILLDEPTAFLDLPSRVEIMLLLRKLSAETGKTILLSTHDLDLALQLADKIWLMAKSREIVSGTPEDLALSGMFNSFFDKESLSFDLNTGTFLLSNQSDKKVQLNVEGVTRIWLEKAFVRKGYQVTDQAELKIFSDPEGFRIEHNATVKTVSNIEFILELLELL